MIQDPFPSVANNTYYETYYGAVNLGELTIFTINAIGLVGNDDATTTPCKERFRLLIEKQDEPGGQWVFYSETWLQLVGTELVGAYTLNESGSYRFTVSVLNKCVRTDYVYTGISVDPCDGTLAVELVQVLHNSCYGTTSGLIDINVTGGLGPYEYLWSNGEVTQDLNGIPAGEYSVIVTDANGCTDVLPSIVVTEPDEIDFGFTTGITTPVCNGTIAVIGLVGGTAPYTYRFQDSGLTILQDGPLDNIGGLCPDTYYVTVLDSLGCVITKTITLAWS